MEISKQVINKIFVDPTSKKEYGSLRPCPKDEMLPAGLPAEWEPFAYDDCGNYFLFRGNEVSFWDHETGDLTVLNCTTDNFESYCIDQQDIKLDPSQVESSWIDPKFGKKHGIDKDGN